MKKILVILVLLAVGFVVGVTLSWLYTGGPAPLPIECPTPAGKGLPATGQTVCYGTVEGQGWVPVPCDNPEFPGQDGFYKAGCPTEGRFVDNKDDTVTDTCTGLMWQRDTAPGTYIWQDALKYCDSLSFAGHDDWRLPNVRELQSIVDYGRFGPAIDPVFVALSDWYWSSSSGVFNPDGAWDVNLFLVGFVSGYVGRGIEVTPGFVRAVRSGP